MRLMTYVRQRALRSCDSLLSTPSTCTRTTRTMGKTSKRNASAPKPAPVEDETVPAYGFDQFKGEGPVFYIRQLGGFVLVIIGTLILCSSYTEDYWYLPIDKDWGPYAALGIICVGAIVHELRPWKRLEYVRSRINEQERQQSSAAMHKKSS